MHNIGAGIMASPFVFAFSLIDRLQGASIVQKREKENVWPSWSLFGFLISTYFYFWLLCLLLYKALRYYFDEKISFFTILFLLLLQMFPLYVFRRPVFSHIYELFLMCIIVYFILKDTKIKFLDTTSAFHVLILGLVNGLIFLVRYNNVFVSLIAPMVIFCFRNGRFSYKEKIKEIIGVYAITLFLAFIFKILPTFVYGETYFHASNAGEFLKWRGPLFLIQRMLYIFFWPDMGLIYTVPFMLLGLYALFFMRYENKKPLIYLFLSLLFNFYITAGVPHFGGWYGYRYIIFSLLPIVVFPFSFLLGKIQKKYGYKKILFIFFAIALVSTFSLLSYEGNKTNLSFIQDFSVKPVSEGGWSGGNLFYQLEVWKTLFKQPTEFLIVIFKGGLLYLIYIISHLFKFSAELPTIILEKYPIFKLDILIKTIIVYIFPFFMYFIFKKQIIFIKNK